jgi:hypothetical protein
MKQINVHILILFAAFLLSSCSPKTVEVTQPSPGLGNNFDAATLQLDSIIVLPAAHDLIPTPLNSAEVAALDNGTQTLSTLLGEYFRGDPRVTVLNTTQTENYRDGYINTPLKEARYIGSKANADAVLMTTVYRFQELDGKEFGADEPASVSFDFQLIHLKSGVILCKGSFEETQQTLLSNILKFGKAYKRNFKFVKGAVLLKEGIDEKFPQCRHLSQ